MRFERDSISFYFQVNEIVFELVYLGNLKQTNNIAVKVFLFKIILAAVSASFSIE